jgi:hypothetical protein
MKSSAKILIAFGALSLALVAFVAIVAVFVK